MDELKSPFDFDTYMLQMAMLASSRSKDPSTKVGAIIVGPDREIRSTGYNGFPRKVKDLKERWERPEKYNWVVHAELNAILNAARIGVSVRNCTLYQPYDALPCATHCMPAIIQAGIGIIVTGHIPFPGKGKGVHYDVDVNAEVMMQEAGIIHRRVLPRDVSAS